MKSRSGDFGLDEATVIGLNRVIQYTIRRLLGGGSRADVEDLVSETWVRFAAACRRDPEFFARAAAAPWLATSARNLALKHVRNLSTRRRLEQRLPEPPVLADGPESHVEANLLLRRVSLSERDLNILLLHQSGHTATEIASLLGLRHKAVESVVWRALQRLRQQFGSVPSQGNRIFLGLQSNHA